MKKHIILIGLFCLALLKVDAGIPQDSTHTYRGKIDLSDMDEMFEDLKNMEIPKIKFDSTEIAEFRESMRMNSAELSKLRKEFKSDFGKDFMGMKEEFREYAKEFKNFGRNFDNNEGKEKNQNNQKGTPKRIETKLFTGISNVKIDHKYGNIIIRQSDKKQVDIEIQYFDSRNVKGTSSASVTNSSLSIITSGTNSVSKINYIISIPEDVSLDIELKYGDIKADKLTSPIRVNQWYGDFNAQKISGNTTPFFDIRYSDLKVTEAQNIKIVGAYSDINIKKVKSAEISGSYSDYVLSEVENVVAERSLLYGDLKIGTIDNIKGKFTYTDVSIGTLVSSIDAKLTYGDIKIKTISPKLKTIDMTGSYTDMTIELPAGIKATYDTSATFGSVDIGKKHTLSNVQQRETNTNVIKQGQIGTGTPTAKIVMRSTYADILIK
ncbi:hypothetical protein M2451_002356 [Dysgonomonas sp. PFB1-18]|uniref:hypothetical protein n=1 Tax=unclassified Dysgonomonas TaxID=2630389 RepID=UPI002475BF84|nr:MULTISPECIES: hypothetical protein [unclassified Dysgonomonas]MDH6307122.1 hypothetical protein [Dysgonomonas sp. PF1-14]MDH6337041.1 hypothetical protein [Dysgonomonas sp. PF1-16]MDH6381027.1 hypothetical protein [Dysgonomonas sp. PFB1-18]MDH6396394.1 hypothetical protein [Dysgonomonas sp. PF1-23]